MIKSTSLLILAALALSGCDQVAQKMGMEDPAKKEARLEPDGKAVGSGCRQSGRAIEDCYAIYSWLPKSAVFAGWREMDEYMRENKLETIVPQLPPPEGPGPEPGHGGGGGPALLPALHPARGGPRRDRPRGSGPGGGRRALRGQGLHRDR